MEFGLLIGHLIRPFETDQAGQGGRVAAFQSQSRVGWIVARLPAGMVIVGAPQAERAKEALDLKFLTPFTLLAGLGMVRRFDPIHRRLQEKGHQLGCRLENGGANQPLQFMNGLAGGRGCHEPIHQRLDLFVLRQEQGAGCVFSRGTYRLTVRPCSRHCKL